MWKIYSLLIAVQFLFIHSVCAQGSPAWEHPLLTCTSTDGINFNQPVLFQDSSGVPCAIRWKGDTLICTFQWFREPMGSPTWDRVAVKFSYDDGSTWTNPVPIVINNFPSSYQRPFDPTLVRFANDSLRIYYSSRDGLSGVPDSLINTYSAFSTDGIHYEFEPGARADHPSQRLIDPAVAFFNHSWHYIILFLPEEFNSARSRISLPIRCTIGQEIILLWIQLNCGSTGVAGPESGTIQHRMAVCGMDMFQQIFKAAIQLFFAKGMESIN